MLSIIRLIFRNDLIAGCFFLLLSYLPFFFPRTTSGLGALVIGASFYLGGLLVGNYLTVRLGGFSLISRIKGSARNNQNFTVVCLLFGAFFAFIASDLGGLWYFPYWSTSTYWIIGFLLAGWAFYLLFLIVCYEAMKLLFDRLLPQRRKVTSYFKYEKHLYSLLFLIGLASLLIVGAAILRATKFFTNFHYTINQPKVPYLKWYFWILSFLGMFLICEYIEYRRKRSSLLKDTLHGYLSPLLAIIVVGIILALSNEIQNFDVYLWRYANYPWPNRTVLSVPLFIIIGWPIQITAVIVFWRAFGNGSSSVIFANAKPALKTRRPQRSGLRKPALAAGGTRR